MLFLVPVGLAALIIFSLWKLSKSRTFQFFGGLTSRGATQEKIVALTFDDAPSEYAKDVLKILQEKNVKATFYVIGENLKKYPEIGKEIVMAGHEIGNHSYSHHRFIFKSQTFIKEEIEHTNQLIRETGYPGLITFRPPNGKKIFGLPWYLHKNNIPTVMWDLEPDTYFPNDRDAIINYTVEKAKPGSIILMHPFCENCAIDRKALPIIIDRLRGNGFKFVKVSQIIGSNN